MKKYEEKPAGVYEVEFDGSKLTSGVYFYQLRSGTFIETRKLVLVR
ncbi:MAG: T9SS type A sorting domain-containing protein [Bacteroidetes bacterium]|nr:T9SS type A sorting domain-containing protein [Bacteroidota bacterium]